MEENEQKGLGGSESITIDPEKVAPKKSPDGDVKVTMKDLGSVNQADKNEDIVINLGKKDEQEHKPVEEVKSEDEEVKVENTETLEEQENVIELVEKPEEEQKVAAQDTAQDTAQDVAHDEKQEEPKREYPENIESLVDFLNENKNASVEDYLRLNADFSSLDPDQALKEYYKQTKPHLSDEDISFIIEDKFGYDEDDVEDREKRRKDLYYKEEVADAKKYLEGLKDKYYKEITSTKRYEPEVKEALDFYNEYKENTQNAESVQKQQGEHFEKLSNDLFTEEFKGFEFNVGDKSYRYNVKDAQSVKKAQSNILNAFEKFLSEDNMLKDAKGYHKALFAANNADQIASHFYEQGKADQIKEQSARDKNIPGARKTFNTSGNTGLKARVVESGGEQYKVKKIS